MEWWIPLLLLIGGAVFIMLLGLPVGISFLFTNLLGTLFFMGGFSGSTFPITSSPQTTLPGGQSPGMIPK